MRKVVLERHTEELKMDVFEPAKGLDTVSRWNALLQFSNTEIEIFVGSSFRKVLAFYPNAKGGINVEYERANGSRGIKAVPASYKFTLGLPKGERL